MITQNNEKMISTLLQEAQPFILNGLSKDKTNLLIVGFEHLIRNIFEDADRELFPDFEAMSLRIGRRIIKEVGETPTEKRLEYVQLEILNREIDRLDWDCRDIAEKSISNSPDMTDLKSQAKENLEKVEEYYHLLKEKGSFWEKKFGRTLSEARHDCEFVLGISEYSSLRLGRMIRILQENGSWPPDWYRELWMKEK
jgi:hypothetical protein